MGLYNLVKLKQSLTNAVDITPVVAEIDLIQQRLNGILIEIPELRPEHYAHVTNLIAQYDTAKQVLQNSVNDYSSQIITINSQITEITHKLFANNYELEERYGDVNQVRVGRKLDSTPELEEIIKQKINLYTNWRFPALEIGCRDGEWTKYLVASDPLYIVDRQPEFLECANNQFPHEYQARLRKYHLKQDHSLSMLPQKQMAFVFSWGYFNYVSLDTMHRVLDEVYAVLRPGGVFMFSYNDGDTPAGAGMAENFAQTYMPKSILVPLVKSLGFEVIDTSMYGSNIHWIEIKKPGELRTIKAHQVLGQIKKRENIFNSEN